MLGIAVPSAMAQTLKVGDAAPKLEVKSFVKGEPVKEFEAGKTYVVEFWATWCGPCKVSIPHLTELQKKYPEVPFIGVSVWEQDQAWSSRSSTRWATRWPTASPSMPFPMAESGNEGAMAKTWMTAAGRNGHSERVHRLRRGQDLLDRPSHGNG